MPSYPLCETQEHNRDHWPSDTAETAACTICQQLKCLHVPSTGLACLGRQATSWESQGIQSQVIKKLSSSCLPKTCVMCHEQQGHLAMKSQHGLEVASDKAVCDANPQTVHTWSHLTMHTVTRANKAYKHWLFFYIYSFCAFSAPHFSDWSISHLHAH